MKRVYDSISKKQFILKISIYLIYFVIFTINQIEN